VSADPESPKGPSSWPAPVLRVGLRWDGESWSTTDLVRVPSMTLPRADDGDPKTMSGFWVDALDAEGRLRYRQRMTDPLLGMEQFAESGEVTRLAHGAHTVDIEALVPDDIPAAVMRITRRTAGDRKPKTVELAIDRERIRPPDKRPPRHDHDEHHG